MQMRSVFLFLNLLLLVSCAQEPSERLFLELIIDGKQVIKKSAVDKDANELHLNYIELINIMDSACKYSYFLNSHISVTEVENFISRNKAQELEKPSTKEIQKTSKLKFSTIRPNQEIISCEVADNECIILPATEKKQLQYSLQLLEILEKNYSMKSNAKWILKSKIVSDNEILENLNEIDITLEDFSCKQKLILK
jgi:hypothetical protein